MLRTTLRAQPARTPSSTTNAITSSTTDTAAAPVTLSLSIWQKMNTDATSVLNGRLPVISTSEPNSPTARANASADAGEDRRAEAGRMTRRKVVKLRGPERRGRLLHLPVELDQDRLHRPDDERQRHEQQRQHDGEARVGHVDAERAARPVQREQGQAGHDRRAARRAGR